jgi:polyhydroxybutyrate depolymerase
VTQTSSADLTRDEIVVEPLIIDFTVYYAVQPPARAVEAPPALLLALHGFGQKCRGFLRQFARLRDQNILVAAPQGPHQLYMQMEPKKVGFNWLTVYEKERSIADFVGYINRLIERLSDTHRFDPARIFILGFSQGSSMAYRFAASQTTPIRGLISCCSDLPADVAEILPGLKPFPVLLAHSPDDPVAEPGKGDDAEQLLERHRFSVSRIVFDGGHAITPELVRLIGAWIEGTAPTGEREKE